LRLSVAHISRRDRTDQDAPLDKCPTKVVALPSDKRRLRVAAPTYRDFDEIQNLITVKMRRGKLVELWPPHLIQNEANVLSFDTEQLADSVIEKSPRNELALLVKMMLMIKSKH
jgi:hypothetical protein